MRRAATAACVVTVLAVLSGCSGSDKTTLRVLAASSLTDAFGDLEQSYEQDHPDVDVVLSFDSSSVLASQVIDGSPADVLATADEPTMQSVADENLLDGQLIAFAQNTLVLVTPPDNPGDITGVEDLQRGGVTFAACVPDAPCGEATEKLLTLDRITATPVTQEDNVRAVLTKVETGVVDAGFVYVTDAQAAGGDVQTVPVTNSASVVNTDPIAVVAATEHAAEAQDWVDLVLSDSGQQVLQSYGFQPAP